MWLGSVARGGVELLAFAPDSRALYTRSAADVLGWDLASRQPTKLGLAQWYATNGGLLPSPDGRHLVLSHANRLDVYDLPARRPAVSKELPLREVWSPTFVDAGRALLTIDYTHAAEQVLVLRAWPSLDPLPRPPDVPAGQWVEVRADPAGGRVVGLLQEDGRNHLAVFDPAFPTAAAARVVRAEAANGWKVAVSPGGDAAAVVRGGRVAAIDLATGAARFDVRASRSDVNRLAYHPGGRLLAAAGNDGAVRFLDAATGVTRRTFDWGIGKLRSVAFSGDGCLCAAGGQKALAVWDVDEP
jgi:WD40 repeat protein